MHQIQFRPEFIPRALGHLVSRMSGVEGKERAVRRKSRGEIKRRKKGRKEGRGRERDGKAFP